MRANYDRDAVRECRRALRINPTCVIASEMLAWLDDRSDIDGVMGTMIDWIDGCLDSGALDDARQGLDLALNFRGVDQDDEKKLKALGARLTKIEDERRTVRLVRGARIMLEGGMAQSAGGMLRRAGEHGVAGLIENPHADHSIVPRKQPRAEEHRSWHGSHGFVRYMEHALIFRKAGKYKLAMDSYTRALVEYPQSKAAKQGFAATRKCLSRREALTMVVRGKKAYSAGRYEQAVKCFQSACRIDPSFETAAGLADSAMQRIDEERRRRLKFRREKMNLMEKARQAYRKGDFENAMQGFKDVLKFDVSSKRARNYIRRIEEKLEGMKKSLKKSRDARVKADRYYRSGLELFAGGDMKGAEKALMQCLELVPDHLRARRDLERVHAVMKAR